MEIGKEIYISLRYTKKDYTVLKLNLKSNERNWEKAIEILDDRLNGRFLTPIRTLLEKDENTNSFTAMAIECLVIETLYQFEQGIDETKNNTSDYSTFLLKMLVSEGIAKKDAIKFYKDIRCGILHSGQTKNNSSLNCDKEKVLTIENNRMSVNVKKMLLLIERYFENYKLLLLSPDNVNLRKAFIGKMKYICNK